MIFWNRGAGLSYCQKWVLVWQTKLERFGFDVATTLVVDREF
jgi:hypothetical protein